MQADINPWCLDREILVAAWDPAIFLQRQPFFSYRLDVIIKGFPLPLWDEFFIIRLLASLGEILFVNTDNLYGIDKSCIAASIRCCDPRAVAKFINVHFEGYWAECRVHIVFWDDIPYIPDRIRPYPDLTDPVNPFGDDPRVTDCLSPIRVNAVSCHDSLRHLFENAENAPAINYADILAKPVQGLPLRTMATLIINGHYIYPEATYLLLCMAMAISLKLVQNRLGFEQNRHGFGGKICCMDCNATKRTSGKLGTFPSTCMHTQETRCVDNTLSLYPLSNLNRCMQDKCHNPNKTLPILYPLSVS